MRTRRTDSSRLLRNEAGQSTVEFLFMVPFLIMIITMSLQFYLVHRAKFDAVVEHRNNAVVSAMKYNAASGNATRWYLEKPVEKKVKIVIGSKVFPEGLKINSSARSYKYYAGTGKR